MFCLTLSTGLDKLISFSIAEFAKLGAACRLHVGACLVRCLVTGESHDFELGRTCIGQASCSGLSKPMRPALDSGFDTLT